MSLGIFWKTLQDLRWQVFWYGLGLGLLGALVVYIYPDYSEQLAGFEMPDAFRGFLGDAAYDTPEGFLSAEFFSFAPVILVIFAIMSGTSALGGEEANGTLELLLAQPISRLRLALQKMAGLVLAACGICLLIYAGWLISVPFVDIDIGYGRLATATARLVLLVLLFQFLSMVAASGLRDRRIATGLVTVFAVISYMASNLASVVDTLQPLRYISVFYYHDGTNALSGSLYVVKLGVIVSLTLLFAVLAVRSFETREIGAQRGLNIPGLRWLTRSKAAA